MKKQRFLFLLCMLIALTACASAQEYVSIAELHDQAEAMGGWWQETYETPNGTLEVDVPVIVPDIEALPVITVERAKPLDDDLYTFIGQSTLVDTDIPTYMVSDGENEYELCLATNGSGLVTSDERESVQGVWIQNGTYMFSHDGGAFKDASPDSYFYPWEADFDVPYARNNVHTLNEAMTIWQAQISKYYPGQEIIVKPKHITVHGSVVSNENSTNKRTGYYEIYAEQYLNGLPIFGSIASNRSQSTFGVPFSHLNHTNDNLYELLNPYRTGAVKGAFTDLEMYFTDNQNHRTMTLVDQVRTVEYADIPLASLDQVIAAVEAEIRNGSIHQVFSLRLGYLLYSDPEMTDYAWAIPRWVLECNYTDAKDSQTAKKFQSHYDESINLWNRWEFAQIPIDAQSGEMIIFTTGDEETFSVPEIITFDAI